MTKSTISTTPGIKTAGVLRTLCAGARVSPSFYGVRMVTLTTNHMPARDAVSKHIKSITNNLRFYNQVIVKIALNRNVNAYGGDAILRGHMPEIKSFAQKLIDRELRREIDSEIAVMARGENIASNQRRQRMLGKYLLSKPYQVIKNFYGVRMQKLSAEIPTGARQENDGFYSDIVHKRVDKTVFSPAQTIVERVPSTPMSTATISDGDLNRIAAQAARQVEKKMRIERERNGKW